MEAEGEGRQTGSGGDRRHSSTQCVSGASTVQQESTQVGAARGPHGCDWVGMALGH